MAQLHAQTLPALRPALLAGAMFSFFASFDDLIITLFVSGAIRAAAATHLERPHPRLDPTVAAAACVMVAMSMIGLGIAEFARSAGCVGSRRNRPIGNCRKPPSCGH